MRTCPGCGTPGHPAGATFCFDCGGRLEGLQCPSCGADVVPGGRFCPGCGGVVVTGERSAADSDAAPVAGPVSARRITSVLFGDLVGFTTLSESRDPEEVRELLSEYFEECRAVIGRYGGVVEKFIGDAVMAVWGVPTTMEDDAERAVRAGLELVARVAALGERLAVEQLALRVGIVTGEVAVTVGAQQQGMVAGDAVNSAARVQAVAAPGQVWVDETTKLLSSSTISYVDVGSHAMKGKADPMPLWAVRAVVAVAGGGQRADGLEGPLVGRDRELRLVKEVFHGVEESGRPALLVVDGEPGVGKSRLGWEFEKYTDGLHTSVRWHSGRCLAYGEGVAYYALAEAVRGRLAAAGSGAGTPGAAGDVDGEYDLSTLLAAGMAAYVPPEDRDWIGPRLGALLGIETVGTYSKEDLFSAWTAFFGAVGASGTSDAPRPVVLVIDDAHHADDGMLAYLEHLLAVADFPVFVLLLARPGLLDSRPSLAANRRVTVVHLEALSAPAMGLLLDGLVAGLPERVRNDLVGRAEGVPLFAVETVRSLIDQDLVVPRGGQYVLADSERLDVTALAAPASLQALIAARLDTLSAEARRVVDQASVVGLGFSRADIAELCPNVADLDGTLSSLVRQQVLRLESDRLSPERGQFRFVQSGVRQVAYGMLSRRDRKTTHLAVCRSLAARQDPGGELAPVVAQHYLDAIEALPDADDVAELSAAACRCLLRAADRAAALGSPAEAAGHLAAARQRCTPDEQLPIEVDLAEQLHRAGAYDQAIEVATRAMERGDAAGDVVRAAAAAATLAQSLMWSRAEYATVERLVRERYAALPPDSDSLKVRLDLVRARGSALLRLGRDFKECAEEQMRLAEQTQDPRAIADGWSFFAMALHDRGLLSLSNALLEQAAQVGRDTRDLRLLTVTLANHCAFVIREDLDKAARLADEAMDVSRRLGDQSWHATSVVNALMAYLLRGDWSAYDRVTSEDLDEDSMRPWQELTRVVVGAARGQSIRPVAQVLPADTELLTDLGYSALRAAALAQEAAASGDPTASTHAVESVDKLYELSRLSDDFTLAWVLGSDIAWRAGDEVALRHLIGIVDAEPGMLPTGLRCQRARLRALVGHREGMPAEEVEGLFREGVDAARRWGSLVWEAHTCADLATWLADQGRREEAAAPAARAREVYDALGASVWRARLDATLAEATV